MGWNTTAIPQIGLSPHLGNFALQQTEAVTTTHSQSTCRVAEPCSSRCIYNTIPTSNTQERLQKRRRKGGKSQRNRICSDRACLLRMSEAMPVKSHQQDSLHMSWTRTAAAHMLKWVGRKPLKPDAHTQETTSEK